MRKKVRDDVITTVKNIITDNFKDAQWGIFFTRNITGDPMNNIYESDDVQVDICYHFEYFEIFGLTAEEINEVRKFYKELQRLQRYLR